MVIHADQRISDVLKQDESLIEVFVALSPAFERLRNPGMRRVMSRLVTVAQAARLAGVDVDELLARLNGRGNVPADTVHAPAQHETSDMPAALAMIAPDHIVTADVREELRAGREPFSRIMAALRSVQPRGALCVRAIFEPVPLYAVMQRQGLSHHTERRADDDWLVWFYREVEPAAEPATETTANRADDGGLTTSSAGVSGESADDDVNVLDVRGLEPPEPMVRTLAALETLPEGATLVQLNVRVPQFLLPLLEERGFTYEIREQGDGLVRLFIRRGDSAAS